MGIPNQDGQFSALLLPPPTLAVEVIRTEPSVCLCVSVCVCLSVCLSVSALTVGCMGKQCKVYTLLTVVRIYTWYTSEA